MTAHSPSGSSYQPLLLELSIGCASPAAWDEMDAERAGRPLTGFGEAPRPPITLERIDWPRLGWQPRWVGDDTSRCVAALQPSNVHTKGAQEWRRLVAGAAQRGETALVVSFVGSWEPTQRPSFMFSGESCPVAFENFEMSVGGDRIALSAAPQIAVGLGRADMDLARRIAGTRPVALPWWELRLDRYETWIPGSGQPVIAEPQGALEPLLVTPAGEVVAGVWTAPDGSVRQYVLPLMDSWQPVLQWLAEHAVPEFVPDAARRARGSLSGDPEFRTKMESAALRELAELEADYEVRQGELTRRAAEATVQADAVRDRLLFGSGEDLVAAVTQVLEDAGLDVVNLDDLLGDTSSADLLVSGGRRSMLVEVKGFSGRPGEDKVNTARRHLETWPQLRPDLTVDGIVLVINHQHRQHPAERDASPYTRAAFVESLPLPVWGTGQLFGWWRLGEFDRIRSAVLGIAGAGSQTLSSDQAGSAVTGAASGSNTADADEGTAPRTRAFRRRWGRVQ